MNAHELARLLRLAKRTGDTLIVAGTDEESSVVIMPVDRYEDLVGGAEIPELDDYVPEELVPIEQEEPVSTEVATERAEVKVQETSDIGQKEGFEGEEERFYLESIE